MTSRRATFQAAVCSADVVEWRFRRLVAAGCGAGLAAELARSGDIDLHAVLDLIDRGCAPELAVRILAPLDAATPGRSSR